MTKHTCYLQLGSNLGDKYEHLAKACSAIKQKVSVIFTSDIYVSEAWGNEDQDDFYNQLVCIETELSPMKLLALVKAIEKDQGRVSNEHWGPRTLDIDILTYTSWVYISKELNIPHRSMQSRRFILKMLVDTVPEWYHPVLRKTAKELFEECKDTLKVSVIS